MNYGIRIIIKAMINRNLASGMNSAQPEDKEVLLREITWQLHTLIATASSYLLFIILLTITLKADALIYLTFLPLYLYHVLKVISCSMHIYKGYDDEMKEDLKDIIESALMILYITGVVVKLCLPHSDCTYLIMPISLIIIVRIVISMGVQSEVNGLYSICRTAFRVFLLFITISVTCKVEGYISSDWKGVLWYFSFMPYWLLLAGLLLLSIGSAAISFNACFCREIGQPTNFNFIISAIWLYYTFFGFTVTTFSLAYFIANYENNGLAPIFSSLYIFIMYLVVLLLFTLLSYQRIMQFWLSMRMHTTEPEVEEAQSRQQINQSHSKDLADVDNGPTEKISRSIPSIMIRITNTLFKPIDSDTSSNDTKKRFGLEGNSNTSLNNMSSKQDFLTKNQNNESINLGLVKLELPEVVPPPVVAYTDTAKDTKEESEKVQSARDPKQIQKRMVKLLNGGKLGEQCCVICCEKSADAVLLPCNHGGLCFDCGNRLARQNAVCHFCRKNFWQVLRMELAEENTTDFLRVVDMTNVLQFPKLPRRNVRGYGN